MIQEDFEHRTDPSGSLDPPPRKPPNALATESSGPNPEDRPRTAVTTVAARPNAFGRFLTRAFDVLDEAADKVAETLNIRPQRPDV